MRERALTVESEDLKFSSATSQLGNSSGPLCRSPRPRDLLSCTFRTTVTEKELLQDLSLLPATCEEYGCRCFCPFNTQNVKRKIIDIS